MDYIKSEEEAIERIEMTWASLDRATKEKILKDAFQEDWSEVRDKIDYDEEVLTIKYDFDRRGYDVPLEFISEDVLYYEDKIKRPPRYRRFNGCEYTISDVTFSKEERDESVKTISKVFGSARSVKWKDPRTGKIEYIIYGIGSDRR